MAEREALQKRYAYSEMSNKVQRSNRSRSTTDATGEVEGLWNVLPPETVGRMGDRIADKGDKNEVVQLMERAAKRRKKKEGGGGSSDIFGSSTILEESRVYRPTHAGSREAHSTLLEILSCKEYLGNQPREVLLSAAEEVLSILKGEGRRDPERKVELGKLLTGKPALNDGVYNKLVLLGKEMDDYLEFRDRSSKEEEENAVDDEMGVAVVFSDSEEENQGEDERSDVEEDVVVDVDESSEEEKSDVEEEEQDGDEERMVQGATGGKTKKSSSSRVLSVHEIDAHYLQRRLSPTLEDTDAAECAKLADEILTVLDFRGGSTLRECENQLLVLLGFERFDFIKLLLANRVRIWGCVSIKRAIDEVTRDAVEKALEDEETGEGRRTLEELRSRSMAEDWKGERMKNVRDDTLRKKGIQDKEEEEGDGATKMSKALDSIQVRSKEEDVSMEDADTTSKAAHELDLESLAFRDGNHTMTNKKCDLPDKSWRAMKPGYEEVHVPAVRSVAPPGEKLVPIEDLPDWTHDAFKGMKSLNRVQSKMADVALKSSENILLCAPTGAGKTNVAM
jgi:pre-mRNA-splicing helicase BRR2